MLSSGAMTTIARLLGLLLVLAALPARAADTVNLGTVPTLGDAPLICAIERGYFKAEGIDATMQSFRNAQDMMPLLARNGLDMIGGAMGVAYFNAVGRGLPVLYILNRSKTPVNHNLMVRADLKDQIRTPKDLKGRAVGMTGIGSTIDFEMAKVLASAGLTLADIDRKDLGLNAIPVAFKNGGIDAGLEISPFIEVAETENAVRWIDPQDYIGHPVEISGMMVNTDWAAAHAELLTRFTVAYIKGVRCYLEAYAHGPNRGELLDMMVKDTPLKNRDTYDHMAWFAVDPNALIDKASVMELQDFFIAQGYLKERLPIERLVDERYAEAALNIVGRAP